MTTTTATDPVQLLYRATANPRLLTVPALNFLCIDGHGDPNTSQQYADAIQALFTVAYTAKFTIKKAGGPNFQVSTLEGLWWADDLSTFVTGDKGAWDWTMMIRQPDPVTPELISRLTDELADKKAMPAIREIRWVTFEEGLAAQVLHVGPYAAEGPTIERLHAFILEQGMTFEGEGRKHHEIYLGDPRRAAPENLRTIIRQPCAPA